MLLTIGIIIVWVLAVGIIIAWGLAVIVILRLTRFGSDESYGERVERERNRRDLNGNL
jgi:fatty acid desaturase